MNSFESVQRPKKSSSMWLIALFFLAVACLIVGVYFNYDSYVSLLTPSDSQPAPAPAPALIVPVVPPYDVDVMAARMTENRDYYEKIRDQGFALYAKRHPQSARYDALAKTVIQLAAYNLIWGDLHGEGVLQDICNFQKKAEDLGCEDQFIANLETAAWDENNYPSNDYWAASLCNQMLRNQEEPTPFKLWETAIAIKGTLDCNADAKTLKANTSSMQLLPKVIASWGKAYFELLKDNAPRTTLYSGPYTLFSKADIDEDTLTLLRKQLDQAYSDAGIDNSLKAALDGNYYVDFGWAARGSGYANTVSADQSNLFDTREAQAETFLEAAYQKYPNEPKICNLMINVSMARSLGKDTMEQWFQRAIKANPGEYAAYSDKAFFLQPRWYGTPEDVWQFGKECVATNRYDDNIPMVLPSDLDLVADNGDPDIFTRPQVWPLVESVFREYLKRYPRSIKYRTDFLQDAFRGNHKDVALEQYKILGQNWDRGVLNDEDYQKIKIYVGQ